jgi:hypothetical protein
LARRVEYNREWRAANVELSRLYGKRWRSKNVDKRNELRQRRNAALRNRLPAWANLRKIRAIYKEAARLTKVTGVRHHVDHIVPVQGVLVSGLHVECNLQILTAAENIRKANSFDELDLLRAA